MTFQIQKYILKIKYNSIKIYVRSLMLHCNLQHELNSTFLSDESVGVVYLCRVVDPCQGLVAGHHGHQVGEGWDGVVLGRGCILSLVHDELLQEPKIENKFEKIYY